MGSKIIRSDRVVELAQAERNRYENSYNSLAIDAVGALCLHNAPVAVALPVDSTVTPRSREAGVQRALVRLNLDSAFTVFRKSNVVFIGSTEVFKS